MRTRYFKKGKYLGNLVLICILTFSSCNHFLDINENPNNPDSASPNLLLPTVEAAIGQVVGNSFQIYGNIWGQYWTQSATANQYISLEKYDIKASAFNTAWSILYRNAFNNAQLILEDEVTSSAEYYKAIAYILKAYTAQLATDAFGDIPLSEATNASEFDNPSYDSQESVYDSIFTYIDQGILLAKTETAADPGAQDMIFNGDMDQWIKFANTLKLRAYLRLSEIDPEKAKSGIASLYSSGAEFLSSDASIAYSTVGGNENPLYNEIAALGYTPNFNASKTAVSNLRRNNDPRELKYYEPQKDEDGNLLDTISYLPQGAYHTEGYSGNSYSSPSKLVGALSTDPTSATAPVKFISAAESYFLQAEAVVRGWSSGSNASDLFKKGIEESFSAVGLANEEADTYFAAAPDANKLFLTNTLKAIITQKYYAMDGFQGFEAWTEWRRTSFPDFFERSLAAPSGSNEFPVRFPYANSEILSNSNAPSLVSIFTPVWWDK